MINFLSFRENKLLIKNISGAFIIKGGGIILSFFSMPAYILFFSDETILGVWFTIMSVINWILAFDLGIGNGLRNKLPEALVKKDIIGAREYISSAYISITALALIIGVGFFLINPHLSWNKILNISTDKISKYILSNTIEVFIIGILVRFILGLTTSILHAFQRSALNNFLNLVSNAIIFIYILFAPAGTIEENLYILSWVNVVATNIPLFIATIIIFFTLLKKMTPSLSKFNFGKAVEILRIGTVLLWLQIVFMIVVTTHPLIISKLIGPAAVVDYQVYYKLFNTFASIFSLILTPVWSAVTVAQAQKRYSWIRKLYYLLLTFVAGTLVINLCTFPFLQRIMDVWLGEQSIHINFKYAFIMSIFNTFFILHNVNTTFSNGMSKFKVQNIGMGIAAILILPFSYIFCEITESWIGVIIACSLSILPYEISQLIWTTRFFKRKMRENQNV